jgi:hypothetical protein
MSTRSTLYRLARALGDVQAAAKGPVPYGRRIVRKTAYRSVNRQLGRGLRRLGL